MTTPLPEEVVAWARAHTGAEHVVSWSIEVVEGGAVAERVEKLTVHLGHDHNPVAAATLVRKSVPPHEIAGLQAAQAVRDRTGVVPELVAAGTDSAQTNAETHTASWWLITPFHSGSPLASRPAPGELFDALAHLHAHYRGQSVEYVPVVDESWWAGLIEQWALPAIRAERHRHRHRHPEKLVDRAERTLAELADHRIVAGTLDALPTTLLHGDVHPANILIGAEGTRLIDWGSSRVGPVALDLANITTLDSPEIAAYGRTWQDVTGDVPDVEEMALGFRWAALQLPVQYLPWVIANTATVEVAATLDNIDAALVELTSPRRDPDQQPG